MLYFYIVAQYKNTTNCKNWNSTPIRNLKFCLFSYTNIIIVSYPALNIHIERVEITNLVIAKLI